MRIEFSARETKIPTMNGKSGLLVLGSWSAALLTTVASVAGPAVKATETRITIPTYLTGEPEPNPIFYDGRGSQGAQGRVYPYPLYDRLTNIKSNQVYTVVYLENQYVRIGILPEIGGRLFEAIDKSNGYNFVYRQHVIKPALIGLIGAWISGGIEWNIPHHHRATTALPVQYQLEDNPDGSKTVWVGELELRQRMRWAVGYTLRPDRSYLQCSIRILNRTPFSNSMLCFANVAVHVNDSYQVIYPPHTQFVTFHSKHEFTTWPVATTRYAGEDFTRGVEVSWYSNHVAATSMFAWNCQDDFFAGYDHGRHAGIMSVADHHIVPGKKFWTWGTGPRGRMWDKILTDSDGPYIELMVGGYSDNQPDYSWLQPDETKSFEMYWYPFREIDGVKNANLEAAVNLEILGDQSARIGFCATAEHPNARALVRAGTQVLLNESCAIGPRKPFTKTVALPIGVAERDLRVSLLVGDKELVAYTPVHLEPAPLPGPVEDPPSPGSIKTTEELYLAGQRIEQFHAPGRSPEPYWEEALRRDPGDARVNTALAIRLLKQARFEEAEEHVRLAIQRLARNYTAPKDGEPYYYLGVALRGRALLQTNSESIRAEAFDAFYKATWSQAWRAPAYFELAELASQRGDSGAALEYLDRCLEANALSSRALGLKTALLRRAGRLEEARVMLATALRSSDPLDPELQAERWLAGDKGAQPALLKAAGQFPAAGLEAAVAYGNAGLWEDGIALLELLSRRSPAPVPALLYYYLGDLHERAGHFSRAAECRQLATAAAPGTVFPFQWEFIPVLRRAMESNPGDGRAPYYLGDLLYDWQPHEAVRLWERAEALDPSFAIVHRNLAYAYARQSTSNQTTRAIAELESAVGAPVRYALHFTELDELYEGAGRPPAERLALLEQNQIVVSTRDDSLSREIGLLVFAGKFDRAIGLMTGRKFSVWEGGSLDVARHWVNAHVLRGRRELESGNPAAALADFEKAKAIPDNLPNDTRGQDRTAELEYWTGMAYQTLGRSDQAAAAWHQSANLCPQVPESAPVNEAGVQMYFSGLAQNQLGQQAAGQAILRRLLESAGDGVSAKAEPEQTIRRHGRRPSAAEAHYLAGLCHAGLGETNEAHGEFQLALRSKPDLLGAEVELNEKGTR